MRVVLECIAGFLFAGVFKGNLSEGFSMKVVHGSLSEESFREPPRKVFQGIQFREVFPGSHSDESSRGALQDFRGVSRAGVSGESFCGVLLGSLSQESVAGVFQWCLSEVSYWGSLSGESFPGVFLGSLSGASFQAHQGFSW